MDDHHQSFNSNALQRKLSPTRSSSSPLPQPSDDHLTTSPYRPRSASSVGPCSSSHNDEACFVEPPFPSPMPISPFLRDSPSSSADHLPRPSPLSPSSPHPIASAPLLSCRLSSSTLPPLLPGKIDFLSALPIELALYILLDFSEPCHLTRSRLVSRAWRALAEDPVLWHQLFKRQPNWSLPNLGTTTAAATLKHSSFMHQDEEEDSFTQHLSRQNSLSSYRSNGSGNRTVARRLSVLLGEVDSLVISPYSTSTDQSIISSNKKQALDWFELFRDRYLIDKRWSNGTMLPRTFKGHKDSVYCLQFDHTKIVTGSRDRTIKVWDIPSGSCLRTLKAHSGSVLCIRFHSELLLSGSSDCKVLVWNLVHGSVLTELVGHTSGVLDLALDSNFIASCSKDCTVRIWKRSSSIVYHRTISGHSGPINAIALTKTGQLFTASGDSTMKLWDVETGSLLRTFEGHLRGLACIRLVEDLGLVITGSNDETIKVWQLSTGKCLRTLIGHEGLVRTLDVDAGERRLVSGSYDKTIKVWDFETGEMKLDFRKGAKAIVFDVSIDFHKIISVGHDSNITMLDFGHGIDCSQFT